MELVVAATGPALPEDAWAAYTHPERWRTWAPHMPPVRATTSPIRTGTQGSFHVGPVTIGRFTVTRYDDAERAWSWSITLAGLTTTGHHTVETHDDGCRCTMTMTLPRPAAVAYRLLAWWALHRLARITASEPPGPHRVVSTVPERG